MNITTQLPSLRLGYDKHRRLIIATQGTYTAVNLPQDGETIDASDVNTDLGGLIDEFNKQVGTTKLADANVTTSKLADNSITQAKISAEAATTFTPNVTGFSGTPTVNYAVYYKYGRLVTIFINVTGTSNATTTGFTVPFTSEYLVTFANGTGADNSITLNTAVRADLPASSTTVSLYANPGASGWNNSGTKAFIISFTYVATS